MSCTCKSQFFLLWFPWVLLLPTAEPHQILLCSTVLCYNLTYKCFFLSLKSMKTHTTTQTHHPPLPDLHMAKALIDVDVEGFYLYFILFSECWHSQQFPTVTYAQRKLSPSTQIKQQSGCLSTDTFLRWSTNPALLERCLGRHRWAPSRG